MIETNWWRESVQLTHPFRIAHGTADHADIPIVSISDDEGIVGFGAAGPARYHGETPDTVAALLPDLLDVVQSAADPFDLATIRSELSAVGGPNPAACAAVEIALVDLFAKRQNLPVSRLLGLGSRVDLASTYTIGIADPDTMADRAKQAVDRGHPALKVKLGSSDDEEILAAIRAVVPEVDIRVDANEAWTPSEAQKRIEQCAAFNVSFVEQPVQSTDYAGLASVHRQSSLPIATDESALVHTDVPTVADRCDIINVKLMKCGGIGEAMKMIHAARAHGREVMLGCMIESAVSIAAAAALAPLVDYVDLDGALLLESDPFEGSPVTPGSINLADRPGLGVSRTQS